MPELFKLLARNLVMGIIAGWVTLALLLATNTAGLADIVFASANPVLPIAILAFGFFITFGSLAMGAAIMMLPYGENTKKGGPKVHTLMAALRKFLPRPVARHELVPSRVKNDSRRTGFHR